MISWVFAIHTGIAGDRDDFADVFAESVEEQAAGGPLAH